MLFVAQAIRVAGGEDYVGPLLAREPRRLEPDAHAAADNDHSPPEQLRLMADRSVCGCCGHGSSSRQRRAGL